MPLDHPDPLNSAASMGRRVGAMIYDALVIMGILFIAALPLPILDAFAPGEWWTILLKRIYLAATMFLYLGGFWVHGGQTVGMRAWKIKLIRSDGAPVRWKDALFRFAAATVSIASLGIGFFWALTNKEKKAWHDSWSNTRLIWIGGAKSAQ